MQQQRTATGWLLRLDAGEELITSLRDFAIAHGIVGGGLTGIGAVGETELGFFVRETRSYIKRTFTGDHEILALTGNFSMLDGVPFPHCHLILCGEDFVAHGGHLFRGMVTVTCEIHIITTAEVIVRTPRPDLGFHPLAPSGA